MYLIASSADALYQKALILALQGATAAPRGQATREMLGPTFHLTDARANVVTFPERKLNYSFSVAEWLWILLGRRDVASVAYHNPRIAEFSDDGKRFAGAYGPRFISQLPYVLETLRRDPDTRQAVVTLWRRNPAPSKDVPCTVSFHYLLREGALHAHTYMRSNDAWLGFPYDLFNFTQLQAYVAAAFGVAVGSYRHTVGSFHLYERDVEGAERVVAAPIGQRVRSPSLTLMPDDLDAGFTDLSSTLGDAESTRARWARWPEPWFTYASVLAYRTHRDASRVLEPYGSLLRAR